MNTQSPASAKPYPRWWPHEAIEALRSGYRTRNTVNGMTFDEILDAALDSAAEAARVEGRREAVHEIRERLLGDAAPVDALYERHTRTILDRVAALNASESPPTPDNADENERQAWADVDAGVADRIGVDDPGWRDASESAQPPEVATDG